MAKVTFELSMDEVLKQQFDELCLDFGMNNNIAFNIFAKAVVREKKIPFDISSNRESERKLAMANFFALREQALINTEGGLTLDEINEEINATRRECDLP